MKFRRLIQRASFALIASGFIVSAPLFAQEPKNKAPAASVARRPEPKALSKNVNNGLAWLAKQQLPNGAWGQGEESVNMGASLDHLKDKGNVADSCMAALALMRAGNTASKGPYAANVQRALEFVIGSVEKSDEKSLAITEVQGTRTQMKIGPYVDTFLGAQLLAEAKGKSGDARFEQRLERALNKVLAKIEMNQRADGTWEGQAWAPVLSQAMGAKAINRAAQAGAPVDDDVRKRAQGYAERQYDAKSGKFAGEGAGIDLYSTAASAGAMGDSVATNDAREGELRDRAINGRDEATREAAKKELAENARSRAQKAEIDRSLSQKLDDPSFVAGFGNNGGEEFLSYMLVSENLVNQGGEEWREWDTFVTANLNRVQNGDGSWTGHHCITGRTFVTSAALLVLTADRAPAPLAAKIKR